METVTVAASRGAGLWDIGLALLTLVVVGAIAWQLIARLRHRES